MEINSEPPIATIKPIPTCEDSDEKQHLKPRAKPTKKKIIRKKNKSKAKSTEIIDENDEADIHSPNTMAPFGIFESETQKCQRLEHYLRKDIENYYKPIIEPHELESLNSLLNSNLIYLSDVYHKDLSEVWKDKISSIPEIRSYLEIVSISNKNKTKFQIVYDETSKKSFAFFPKDKIEIVFYELNEFETELLLKREKFMENIQISKQRFSENSKNLHENNVQQEMSELSMEIVFLFKNLYESTKALKTHSTRIQENVEILNRIEPSLELYPKAEDKYISFLLKKLSLHAIKDEDIDYFNFFKNNELIEFCSGPPQANITDQREFEEFMRKKKNKKGRKGKYVLHSACLGCCSSYFEQYNSFNYCQECFIRFHHSCYAGFPANEIVYVNSREEKEVLCETCYIKKTNPNVKNRGCECDFCGLKGLLSVSASNSKRIHIFCMLFNGLWTVEDMRITYKASKNGQSEYGLKCSLCNTSGSFLHYSTCCEKVAHVSCAFFAGWKIEGKLIKSENEIDLKMKCCNVPFAENEKRRKFITNFKKQAYNF